VIRRYRPDVVVLVFSGTPRDGHGQHQTSAILGKEAFEAAADPKKFPEQLRLVQVWKPTRLIRATFNFPGAGGGRGTPPQAPAPAAKAGHVETGGYNPILGYSYEELAILSRSMHHSQGTGAMRRPGAFTTDFELVGGPPAVKDPFEGIDTTWNRLPGGAPVGPILSEAIRTFEPAHPERTVAQLAKVRPLIAAIADPLAKVKLAELDETIALCSGMWVDAQARHPEVTPGSPLNFTLTVLNRSTAEIAFDGAQVEGMFNEAIPAKTGKLGYNQSLTADFSKPVPATQSYSQPYWLVKPQTADVYTIEDQALIGLPDTPPAAQVRVKLSVNGTPFELVRPVHHRYADRAEGERDRPLLVVPAVAVNFPDSHAIFPSAAMRTVQVSVKANVPKASGELRLDPPAGWKVEPRSRPFQIAVTGEQQELNFQVTPPDGETTAALKAVATKGGREIASGMDVIAYSHIPTQAIFPPSTMKLVRSNIQVTARKIGYIMGAGDEMPDALRQLGLDVTLLSQSDLEQGDLARFDAIVAGIRAYSVRSDVRANQPRLMEYVRNGGTYVVQYQMGEGGRGPGGPPQPGQQAEAVNSNIGPYSITIPAGNGFRVTVEEAPVGFPHADNRLLQAPNHISEKDFQGWVQERGLNFATKWDSQYQTVLASHDPGEQPLEGGELWTHYGKGVYVFTAYSWFRQLPAGVPGAYRLFANLLSAK
jgi:hypothetical protein